MQNSAQVLSDWMLSKQNSPDSAREQGQPLRSRKYSQIPHHRSHAITQKVRCASFNGLKQGFLMIYGMHITLHLMEKKPKTLAVV